MHHFKAYTDLYCGMNDTLSMFTQSYDETQADIM